MLYRNKVEAMQLLSNDNFFIWVFGLFMVQMNMNSILNQNQIIFNDRKTGSNSDHADKKHLLV